MMDQFSDEVLAAAAREREVVLTTTGRETGKPRRVTIWIATDGRRLFIRSGQGLKRHWPRNLLEGGSGALQLGNTPVNVRPRHVTDLAEARSVSALYKRKYGPFVRASRPSQPLTPGEQATFELLPA